MSGWALLSWGLAGAALATFPALLLAATIGGPWGQSAAVICWGAGALAGWAVGLRVHSWRDTRDWRRNHPH